MTIKWKHRKAMIERGRLMLRAHWRNFCGNEDLSRWFRRELPKYATFTFTGKGVRLEQAEQRFWAACSYLETHP